MSFGLNGFKPYLRLDLKLGMLGGSTTHFHSIDF